MALSLPNIRYGGKARRTGGTLRITENGIGWKSKQGKSISLLKDKIDRVQWIPTGKGRQQLRIYANEGQCHIYDGIPTQEFHRIEDCVKTFFDLDITKNSLHTKGWNWGKIEFEGSFLNFNIEGKKSFDLPLSIVEQAHHDKNDVVIGYPQDSSTSIEGAETLMEMRLWVPNVEETSGPSSAEKVLNTVLEEAEVLSAKGTGIVTFEQVVVKTPRGRYDLDIFGNFMRMKGTQSSTINYDCITRISQLKTIDGKDRILILSLDPPLRRGHTSYPHILMQFPAENVLSVDLSLSKEQLRKYDGKLKEEMTGNKFDLILQVFRVVTNIKVTKMGNFSSVVDVDAVRCSLKAHDGYLYPLAKCFIFIYNPITLIPYEMISHVEFARLGVSKTNRTFDLVIFMKQTKHATDTNYIFNSLNKDEHQGLESFLRKAGIEVRGTTAEANQQPQILLGDEEESEDEDFSSGVESEDELEFDDGDAVPISEDPVLAPESDEEIEGDVLSEEETTEKPGKKRRKRPSNSSTSPPAKKAKK